MLSTQDLSGFETLPVARIKRASADEATPELDDDYIPPLLAIDAWPPLELEIVRAIYDIVGEKIEVLSERAVGRNLNLSSLQPGDLEDLLLLSALNESYALLHCLAFAQGVHPFVAYCELCALVGKLSIFDPSRRLGDVPAYDHDDLARIFKWVKLRIEQLLGSRQKLYYEQRYFVGAERGMQVSLEPEWFHSGWEWYVGVNGQNVSESLCRDLLRPGKLDWKTGSTQQIDLIFRHGLPGVEQVELTHPPRELPPHGWIFYQMRRDNAAWKDVLATQTLALRFQEELIGNLENLRGQRRLEVVLPDRRAILEFALFAVPKQQK
jgi:type VI secretion system protein ImpJ